MKAWGLNDHGQLGDGTTTNRTTPVTVTGITGATFIDAGSFHSVAVIGDGTIRTWGLNNHGQLGDGTTTERHTAVTPAGVVANRASAGFGFTVIRD